MPDHPRYGHSARSIRVPDDLWLPALQAAARRGESLSHAIRTFLESYVRDTEES